MTIENDTEVTRERFDTIHRAFRERFRIGDVVVANHGVSVMVWTGDTERGELVFSASANTPQDMVRGLGLAGHSALLAEVERLRAEVARLAKERDTAVATEREEGGKLCDLCAQFARAMGDPHAEEYEKLAAAIRAGSRALLPLEVSE